MREADSDRAYFVVSQHGGDNQVLVDLVPMDSDTWTGKLPVLALMKAWPPLGSNSRSKVAISWRPRCCMTTAWYAPANEMFFST